MEGRQTDGDVGDVHVSKGRSYQDENWYHDTALRVFDRWYHVSTPNIRVGTGIMIPIRDTFFDPCQKRYHDTVS